jgi:hypothetical protein
MSGTPIIKIKGLAEFQKSLRQIDANLPKQLRIMLNQASTVVIRWAVPRIPTRTGRAAGSVKAKSSQRESRVSMGGRRAPYMPWLDFGGKVGPNRSVERPFLVRGRYLYAGLEANAEDVQKIIEEGLAALATGAGLEVS